LIAAYDSSTVAEGVDFELTGNEEPRRVEGLGCDNVYASYV